MYISVNREVSGDCETAGYLPLMSKQNLPYSDKCFILSEQCRYNSGITVLFCRHQSVNQFNWHEQHATSS